MPNFKRWFRNSPQLILQWVTNQLRHIFLICLGIYWGKIRQKFSRKPEVVFLVYGDERHKRVCWSVRREQKIGLFGLISFLKVVMNGRKVSGLIVATTKTQKELDSEPEIALQVVLAIKQRFPWAKAIALAGQLPSWVHRASPDHPLPEPCVDGTLGTLYTVINSVRSAASLHFSGQRVTVAVVGGAGYTGSRVAEQLSQEPVVEQVIALDLSHNSSSSADRLIKTSDSARLKEADLVVVLTAKGDDARKALTNIRKGTIVLDDTHPMMGRKLVATLRQSEAVVYKVSTTVGALSGSSRMFPQLPDFEPGDLPGCLVGALVRVSTTMAHVSYKEFERQAVRLGMVARLGKHPKL